MDSYIYDLDTLSRVKILLDFVDTADGYYDFDDILTMYIMRAENFVKNYCNQEVITQELSEIVEDIVVFNFRNKGVENLKSETKGRLSETYRDGLPSDIIQRLKKNKRLKFIQNTIPKGIFFE
jgi:hypothetical protein